LSGGMQVAAAAVRSNAWFGICYRINAGLNTPL